MALKQIKNKKCPGEDGITAEIQKVTGSELWEVIRTLLNKCVEEQKIPKHWQRSEAILLFKKGEQAYLDNYRPISLLSHLYKLLMKIITNRLTKKLVSYQPVEQAGFRKYYSTTDHIQTLHNARVDSRYTGLLESIYEISVMVVKLDEDLKTEQIKAKKGERQGDIISSKLFTLALEDVFKGINWEETGVRIDGELTATTCVLRTTWF
ncbi:hypothetical protein HUJ05_001570 [Dendroctonus ponderosae]|nr:hypothetical protein HUJ05_001570 [Dendroctonus ponderosae]